MRGAITRLDDVKASNGWRCQDLSPSGLAFDLVRQIGNAQFSLERRLSARADIFTTQISTPIWHTYTLLLYFMAILRRLPYCQGSSIFQLGRHGC